jgi:transcriptional regulator of acetoin/glycerol metabolism
VTNCKPNPLARVALRGEVPRELVWLLPLVNINPFGAGGLDADLVAAFARDARGGWSISLRTGAAATTTDRGFICDNVYVAATFLLSRALGLVDPFLVAGEDTFATLRQAIALALGPANVIIEGETGVGKRSLAALLNRAGGGGELTRIDCAVPEDVARELAALARGRLETGESPRRMVLLDRIAELPPAHQVALAREIAAQPRAVRYLATAKVPIQGRVESGAFAPALSALFTATLRLAPLARRRADLVMLARHFLRNANPLLDFDGRALAILRDQRFPGNVRELHNLITRLEIYERGECARTIDAACLRRQLCGVAEAESEEVTSVPPRRVCATGGRRAHLRLVQPVRAKSQPSAIPAEPHVNSR